MFESFDAQLLPTVGGLLALAGSLILVFDLRGDAIASKARDVEIYMAKLNEAIETEVPELDSSGPGADIASDLNSAIGVLSGGASQAQAQNVRLHTRLLQDIQSEQAKHRRTEKFAVALTILGGILALL